MSEALSCWCPLLNATTGGLAILLVHGSFRRRTVRVTAASATGVALWNEQNRLGFERSGR